MIKKILIANRGEIAVRIVRACRDLGIKTIAVYSEVDKNALHLTYADEAYNLGSPLVNESYLNQDKVIAVARKYKADAIHPGYGFLAENAEFTQRCVNEGIKFIGPTAKSQDISGKKINAKKIAQEYGIPVVPGAIRRLKDIGQANKIASRIGYPLLLKASAGGGGKGMRRVENKEQLESALNNSQSEANNAFGDATLYMEKIIEPCRHIEVQILADNYGNIVYLGERECSIQRRHQKLIGLTLRIIQG